MWATPVRRSRRNVLFQDRKAVIDADDKGDKCAEEDHFAEQECLFFSDERFSEHGVESGTRQDHKDQAFKVVII